MLGKNWFGYQVTTKKAFLNYLRTNRQEAKDAGRQLPAEYQEEETLTL
ncbi:MAG: hypothetical protein ACJ797_04420 [Ktedonobacteraceae bacterium]